MKTLLPGLLFVMAFVFAFVPSSVSAHQSGCHRWHSCPSDTGSYVCGDLGYTSGCPKKVTAPASTTITPKATPTATKKVAPAKKTVKSKVTPKTSKSVWVDGYYRSNGTYVKGHWRSK